MKEIVFVRHTSVDIPRGICYGQTDVGLADSFFDEAVIVRKGLNYFPSFDVVYTSPLGRCSRLAEFCGFPNAVRDDRLMELNFGDWEMQHFDEIKDERLELWYDDYINVAPTGGESFRQQYERVEEFIDMLKSDSDAQRVLVFTHGGVITAAKIYAGIVEWENAFRQPSPYGCIFTMIL